MLSPVHIAIDLETISLDPSAVILSVGLAAFTLVGGVVGTYYVELNQNDQRLVGRTVDPNTIKWWREQTECALLERTAYPPPTGMSNEDALDGIASFMIRFPNQLAGVWGYGSDFDNATLQSIYRSYNHPVPWSYRLNRCGRTVTKLAEVDKPANTGRHHHALDDAIWQAEYIRRALIKLGVPG